jgi:hypothetical protein
MQRAKLVGPFIALFWVVFVAITLIGTVLA